MGGLSCDRNFYPRSPCGERPPVRDVIQWEGMNFYPRSPCGERPRLMCFWPFGRLFLSTLSLRRATYQYLSPNFWRGYFYPRSPCGERPFCLGAKADSVSISIHALLAESDNSAYGALDGASISIHALLAESDKTLPRRIIGGSNNFYPRSPCGERPTVHQ